MLHDASGCPWWSHYLLSLSSPSTPTSTPLALIHSCNIGTAAADFHSQAKLTPQSGRLVLGTDLMKHNLRQYCHHCPDWSHHRSLTKAALLICDLVESSWYAWWGQRCSCTRSTWSHWGFQMICLAYCVFSLLIRCFWALTDLMCLCTLRISWNIYL